VILFVTLILTVRGSAQTTAAASGSCTPPPSGMVAWWPLDETSGTTVTDIVGGYNGTAQPGPIGAFVGPGPVTSASWPLPNFPVGMVSNSLFFYGNRYVEVPHNAALDPGTGGFTVDAWVIFTKTPGSHLLDIAQKLGSPARWQFYIHYSNSDTTGLLNLQVRGVSGGLIQGGTDAPITPQAWHHVAVTLQRGAQDVVNLHVDGTLVSTHSFASVGNVASSSNLFIGTGDLVGREIAVDELEILSRALTSKEIQDLYAAGSAGKCKPSCVSPPSGMVAWWPLDEPNGATAVNDIAPGFNNVATPHAANGLPTTIGPPSAGPVLVTAPPLNLASGMVAGALYFYGPYLEVANHPDLNFGTGPFSIDAWIYYVPTSPLPPGSSPVIAPIVDKFDSAGNKGYALFLYIDTTATHLRFRMWDGTNFSVTGFPTPGVLPLTWTHLAVTVDRPGPGVSVYVNGMPAVTLSPPAPGNIDNAAPLWIGRSRLHTLLKAGFREIAIDELEIFNRVLTAAEVNALFKAGPAGKCKPPYDWGDAPDSPTSPGYPTLMIHNGAQHKIGGPWLGNASDKPDAEWDGQPQAHALGDNMNGSNDENGVLIPPLIQGMSASATVEVSGGGGVVQGWIDFNGNQTWEPAEKIFDGFLTDGIHTISFAVPATAVVGQPFARFRISTTGGLGPDGPASDGEVEDYEVRIQAPPATILPGVVTQCPVVATACPMVLTQCPTTATQCPAKETSCPAFDTRCPLSQTKCPVTQTSCPAVSTQCPATATRCPDFRTACPPVTTQCPVTQTSCPAVSTQCPPTGTQCPVRETSCPAVDTRCPVSQTKCPVAQTSCPVVSTQCPPVSTQCPPVLTRCPAPCQPPTSVGGVARVRLDAAGEVCPAVEGPCPLVIKG